MLTASRGKYSMWVDRMESGTAISVHTQYTTLDIDASHHPDVVASAGAMPFPDASFDGILCVETLMDIWDLEAAAREMARILKPGGMLLLTVSYMGALYNEPNNYWRFTAFALERLFQRYFSTITVQRRGGTSRPDVSSGSATVSSGGISTIDRSLVVSSPSSLVLSAAWRSFLTAWTTLQRTASSPSAIT